MPKESLILDLDLRGLVRDPLNRVAAERQRTIYPNAPTPAQMFRFVLNESGGLAQVGPYGETDMVTSKSAFEVSNLQIANETRKQTTDVLSEMGRPRGILSIQRLPFMDVTQPSAHCEAVETLFLDLMDKADVCNAWLEATRTQRVWRARALMNIHPKYTQNLPGVLKMCLELEGMSTTPLAEAESYSRRYPLAGR